MKTKVVALILLFAFSHVFAEKASANIYGLTKISPGIYAYIGSQNINGREKTVSRRVYLFNAGGAFPEGARLLVTSTSSEIINEDGVNIDGLEYFDIDSGYYFYSIVDISFAWPPRNPRVSLGYEVVLARNGLLDISGEAMVGQTLSALVSDEDGVSNTVIYQWFADDIAIVGATASSYMLTADDEGTLITVSANYTDDGGSEESLESASVGPVAPLPVNIVGSVSVSGTYLIGDTITASVNDENGIDADSVNYQWLADGVSLEGEIAATLELSPEFIGQNVSVVASYTDSASFDESVSSDSARPVTLVVNSSIELAEAVANSNDGDWIGLADGDYVNMDELQLANAVTLTLAKDSSAVISGATCIHMFADDAALVGLSFDAIDMIVGSTCDSNGDSSVYIDADNVEIRENTFLGEVAVPSVSPYNWISLKDSYALIERNVFANKNTSLPGAAITIFNNASNGDQYSHVIQYNLFRDFVGDSVSTAYAIQVGRSTQVSANAEGSHVVRYNRFENVQTSQRVIRVQSSRNYIYNNTIEDSTGHIGLENGQRNTVSNNIILPTGEDDASNDSGITFAPYGHVVTNNYIAGLRTTSSLRGALLADSERALDASSLELEVIPVTLSNNTVLNSRQPIHLSERDCVPGAFIVNFENNLIANGEDPTVDVVTDSGTDYGFEGRTANGVARDAVIDNCELNSASTANNEHYYSSNLSTNSIFTFPFLIGGDNVSGTEGAAEISAGNFGLFEGTGADAGIGADTSRLVYLSATDVGPGSQYEAPAQPVTFDEDINLDLSRWNITFPDGTQEDNPQWLLDGNTRDDEFYYTDAGAMVFKSANITSGTTTNSSFPRSELRGMLRGPEPDPRPAGFPSVQGFNRNNWVFSSSSQSIQTLMGGVDGTMDTCLSVNAVSTDGDRGQVGRTIVGQIHASEDEPAKLYYRKLPENELGAIYVNHEAPGLGDITYNLVGHSSSTAANPVDGVALDEVWCYQIKTIGQTLIVTVRREGKPDVQQVIVMEDDYIDDWMYFRAGNYNQNNSGPDSFAQVRIFSLVTSHGEAPTGPIDGGGTDGGNGVGDLVDGDVTALLANIATAVEGTTVEIPEGNYKAVTLDLVTNGVSLVPVDGAQVVFSGATCIYIPADDVTMSGLEFVNISQVDVSTCQSRGNASIVLEGDRINFSENLLDSDTFNPIAEGQTTYNWVSVRGSDVLIERNTFQNKRGFNSDSSAQARGSYISVFTTGSGVNNTIQYNLFKDMLLGEESNSHAIQLGRTTGLDSIEEGLNTVQFNRFENIDSRTRMIRVQGSSNVIHANTVVGSQGMIALEDGHSNVVTNNVILPSGSDSNDGGISFAPYGHTVSNNYIAGPRTSSGERAGLYFNFNATGDGNSSLIPSAVTLKSNTVLNSRQAILIGGNSCASTAFPALAENNLIANGISGVAEFEGETQNNRSAVRDDCALDTGVATFNNNHVYSANQSVAGTFDITSFGAENITGVDAQADIVDDGQGFVVGQGVDLGIGADTSSLFIIEETDVGVGSLSVF